MIQRSRLLPYGALSVLLGLVAVFRAVDAETFVAHRGGNTIGELRIVEARYEDTLLDIARNFDVGHDEMIAANPQVSVWLPGNGTRVLIPSFYILPKGPQTGLVINIGELRAYWFHGGSITTYPVSVGRAGWETPLGTTRVIKKVTDPPWYPPLSIRREHAETGDTLPLVVPGGHVANPLGRYALYLGMRGYLIHGTRSEHTFGIGMRVTHGCIRLYPEDMEELFSRVLVGTPVRIINQPIKYTWRNEELLVEVHKVPHVEENGKGGSSGYSEIIFDMIRSGIPSESIDRERLIRALALADGVPHVIGRRLVPDLSGK